MTDNLVMSFPINETHHINFSLRLCINSSCYSHLQIICRRYVFKCQLCSPITNSLGSNHPDISQATVQASFLSLGQLYHEKVTPFSWKVTCFESNVIFIKMKLIDLKMFPVPTNSSFLYSKLLLSLYEFSHFPDTFVQMFGHLSSSPLLIYSPVSFQFIQLPSVSWVLSWEIQMKNSSELEFVYFFSSQ
jgi:hypothetical protein